VVSAYETGVVAEVRKFKDPHRLNRVVLLSDGLANVGPRNADEFAKLGRDLLREGISVSTIGLGKDYNEDLMLQLAKAGDGNHAFASAPDDLIKIFNMEFDDVLASCAQTVSIDVELQPGARVVRAISREGEITAAHAKFQMNQIYQETEHYVLLEVELEGKAAAADQDLGRVRVAYSVPDSGAKQTLDTRIRGRFSASKDEAKASVDQQVMASVVEQTTRERAQRAVTLRDQGKRDEATKLFNENVAEIKAYVANGGKPSVDLDNLVGNTITTERAAALPRAMECLSQGVARARHERGRSKSKY
jgi:Ca-activated chloride channel family protein